MNVTANFSGTKHEDPFREKGRGEKDHNKPPGGEVLAGRHSQVKRADEGTEDGRGYPCAGGAELGSQVQEQTSPHGQQQRHGDAD